MGSKTILIGISGGIHSFLAAYLLKRQGYAVVGLNILFAEGEEAGTKVEQERVESFLNNLDIPYHQIQEYTSYHSRVTDLIVSSRFSGRTFCAPYALNALLFDTLTDQMKHFKADSIATGHRARLIHNHRKNSYEIHQAKEAQWDQSHLLATLSYRQLAHLELPLSGMREDDTQRIVQSLGLTSPSAPSCLDYTYANLTPLLEKRIPSNLRQEGNIIHQQDMNILGTHQGIHHFCVGSPLPEKQILFKDEEYRPKDFIPVEVQWQDNTVVVMKKNQWTPCTHILLSQCHYTTKMNGEIFAQGYLKIGVNNGKLIPVHIRHLNSGHCFCELETPWPLPLFPGESAVIYSGYQGEQINLTGQVLRIERLPHKKFSFKY